PSGARVWNGLPSSIRQRLCPLTTASRCWRAGVGGSKRYRPRRCTPRSWGGSARNLLPEAGSRSSRLPPRGLLTPSLPRARAGGPLFSLPLPFPRTPRGGRRTAGGHRAEGENPPAAPPHPGGGHPLVGSVPQGAAPVVDAEAGLVGQHGGVPANAHHLAR